MKRERKMKPEYFSDDGLTQLGAKKLLEFINGHPYVQHRLAGEDISDLRDMTPRVELRPNEVRQALDLPPDVATSSEMIYTRMRNVATDFNYYGSDVVGINLKKVKLLARGFGVFTSPQRTT